jgi:hypothetical protein
MIYFCVKFQKDPLYGLNCHRNKLGGLKIIGFLSSNFMKLCRNIHRSVWQLLGMNKFKLAAIAMVTKVQKMLNSNRTADPFETVGNQISPKSGDFCILAAILVTNGHHSKPKWSPYGAACLTVCKYPFLLKSVHF